MTIQALTHGTTFSAEPTEAARSSKHSGVIGALWLLIKGFAKETEK
jgi:hypothetical protein